MPKHFIALTHLKQQEEYSCVPACVRMVLEYYGDRRSETELITRLECTPFGTTAEATRGVSDLGYEVEVAYSTFEEIQIHIASRRPLVAFLRTGALDYWSSDAPHAVLVIGYDDQFVYLDDPFFDVAPQKSSLPSFQRAWWKAKNRMCVIRPKIA